MSFNLRVNSVVKEGLAPASRLTDCQKGCVMEKQGCTMLFSYFAAFLVCGWFCEDVKNLGT